MYHGIIIVELAKTFQVAPSQEMFIILSSVPSSFVVQSLFDWLRHSVIEAYFLPIFSKVLQRGFL